MKQLPKTLVTLFLCSASTALTSAAPLLEYSASALRDTVLLYESVLVVFTVTTASPEPIPISPLTLDATRHSMDILDEAGVSVLGYTLTGPYGPNAGMTVALGDTATGYITPNHFSVYRIGAGRTYLPIGKYKAVFRWLYDPWGRARFNDSPYLYDTVAFTVVPPSNRTDSLAMKSVRRAFDLLREQNSRLLWEIFSSYPQSPYARDCLRSLALRMGPRSTTLDPVSFTDVIHQFALIAPNDPNIKRKLRYLIGVSGISDTVASVLREISSKVPGTIAERTARSILDEFRRD